VQGVLVDAQPMAGALVDVCFGSLADILTSPRHVRFVPNNGRWAAHPSQHLDNGFVSTRPNLIKPVRRDQRPAA